MAMRKGQVVIHRVFAGLTFEREGRREEKIVTDGKEGGVVL